MGTGFFTDWQTLVSLGLGVAALAYVGRRWWPTLAGLMGHAAPGRNATAVDPGGSACGQAGQGVSAPPASACGSGCGQCGQGGATPSKDHRVQIVKHITH